MADHGTVIALPIPNILVLTGALAPMTGGVNFGTVIPLPTPNGWLVKVGSYSIAGTTPPAAGYTPPIAGQLWPRGDLDAE